MENNTYKTKIWKRILSMVLAIIIGFGTFVTITFGNSKFQKWLGVNSILSAYASEFVDVSMAVAVNEDAMIENNHLIDLENKDGSNTAYIFSEPISYEDENGNLKTKDISVEKQKDRKLKSQGYEYANGQNDYRINFSEDKSKGILVQFDGFSYSLAPSSIYDAEGEKSSSVVMNEEFEIFEYTGAFGVGTNLKFYPQLNGVKDEIVLDSNVGKNNFAFELNTENCTALLNDDGTVSLVDNENNTVQEFQAPFAYDSKYVAGIKDEHYSDCAYALEEIEKGNYILTVTVDSKWLSSESTTYPVVIDPTTSRISNMYDLPIHTKRTTTGATVDNNAVGTSNELGTSRTLVKFQKPSEIKPYAKINSAYYWTRELTGRTSTFTCGVYKIIESWNENNVWTSRPKYNSTMITSRNINSASNDYEPSPYWYKFNITSLVQQWYTGTTNYGFMMKYENESASTKNLRTFAQQEYSSSSWCPYTVINYTNDTTAPTATVSASTTSWTNSSVKISISGAEDNAGASGMHTTPYSFNTSNSTYNWGTATSNNYSQNCTVYVSVRDKAGNIRTYTKSITNIDKLRPAKPNVSLSTNEWTNDNVIATVQSTDANSNSTNGKSGTKYYCCTKTQYTNDNNVTWKSVNTVDSSTTFTISDNDTYYIYAKDQAGNISEPEIINAKIDKEKPIISDVSVTEDAENITVEITATDPLSGIYKYSFDGGSEWCNEKSFEFEKTSNSISVAVMDNAGNIADEITELKNPKFYSDNGLVGIYDPNSTNYEIEYKISNDGKWFDYTEPFAVPINGANVYARFKDSKINASKSFSSNVLEKLSNYTEQNVDLTIKNNDADFSIIRTYDSSTNDWFFSTQSNITVIENENVYSVKLPDSTTAVFVKNKNNTYISPITDYTLIIDDDEYIVKLDDQELLYNKTTGRLLSVNNKNHSVNLIYDNAGDLVEINAKETVSDNNIEEHKYIIVESNGKIRSIKDPLNQELIYTYDDNNLTKVYYKGSTIQHKRNIDENTYMDIILSEYSYDNNKLSFSNKSSINYSENKLSSMILPTGETTNYTFGLEKFNSYNIDNVSDDFDVIEVNVNDDITCYNYQSLPVIEISGNNAFVYTYDNAGELLEKTEYKKSGDSYVKIENEDESAVNSEDDSQDELPESSDSDESATDEEDPVVTTSVEDGKTTTEITYHDEHSRVSSVETVVTKTDETSDDNEISREKTEYTYFGESEDISKTVDTTTKSGVTITNTTEYYSDGKIHIEDTVTKKANKSNETKIIYTYTPFGNIETVNTLIYRDSDIYSASNYKYFYDALNRNTKIVSIDGNQDETLVSEYKYNPLGNIIYQNENGVVTRFIYDEYSRLVQQINKKDYNASNDGLNDSENSLDSYSDNNVGYRYKYSDDGNLEYEINDIGIRTDYTYHKNTSIVATEKFDIYEYDYNINGDIEDIWVSKSNSESPYAHYNYDENNNNRSIEYANGQSVEYHYNDNGNVTEQLFKATETDTATLQFKYIYDTSDMDKLLYKIDYINNVTEWYEDNDRVAIYKLAYNSNNEIVKGNLISSYQNTIDENDDTITYHTNSNNNSSIVYTYSENSDSFVTDYGTYNYTYSENDDGSTTSILKNSDNNAIISYNYTYNDDGSVSGYSVTTPSYSKAFKYDYDSKGRIKSYGSVLSDNNYNPNDYQHYYYGERDELIRADISNGQVINGTVKYIYDNRDNMYKAEIFDYTSAEEITGSPVDTLEFSFSYEDKVWIDSIETTDTAEETFFYDDNGNPISMEDLNFHWTNGRNLSSITYTNDNNEVATLISFKYDDNGIRVSKTYGDTTTYYTNINGTITSQYELDENGEQTNIIEFVYDSNNEVVGFTYQNDTYFYIKNIQGDITNIIDNEGNVLVNYYYNAWGVPYSEDLSNDNLAEINPMRYRGYYYDCEMGLYYLQSRYYIPTFCRFLNSDLPEYAQMQKDDYAGTNLFAYCCNDPTNNIDPSGYWRKNVHNGYNNGASVFTRIKGKMTEYGTYFWAKDCGFSNHNAYLLSFHCNNLDNKYPSTTYAIALISSDNYSLTQLQEFKKWQYYHFNGSKSNSAQDTREMYYTIQRKNAIRDWKNGKKAQALIELGYGLHALQDIYAHGNMGKGKSIPVQSKNADEIGYDWSNEALTKVSKSEYYKSRLCETRDETYKYLKYFINKVGGKSQVSKDVRG